MDGCGTERHGSKGKEEKQNAHLRAETGYKKIESFLVGRDVSDRQRLSSAILLLQKLEGEKPLLRQNGPHMKSTHPEPVLPPETREPVNRTQYRVLVDSTRLRLLEGRHSVGLELRHHQYLH
jgi:hypothetical protein